MATCALILKPPCCFTDVDGKIVPVQEPLLAAGRPSQPYPLAREPSVVKWDNTKVIQWMADNDLDQ